MVPHRVMESEYQECLEFLYGLQPFGAKLGLDRTFQLAHLVGNPQEQLCFIHVAGTNGKGSTCAMLESIYRHAGIRAGLFTSPHLTHFGERIQVNRQFIPNTDIIRLVNELKPLLKRFPEPEHPTFFEVATILALRYFLEEKCDVVIWETGLGGRLDSTNIVTPLASVITSIGLDHQQWLGDTLPQIAAEKAGIIKTEVPVLTSVDQPEAFEMIASTAVEKRAPLTRITMADTHSPPLDTIQLPLCGRHQRLNAALAVAVARTLSRRFSIDENSLRTGLESVHWPGRGETVQTAPGQTYLLDGAHNPAAAEALAETVQARFSNLRPALIVGLFADKAIEETCRRLAPMADRILAVPIASKRTATAATVAEACAACNPAAHVTCSDSLESALHEARDQPLVVVTGSLYLVGQARELLGLTSGEHALERALNDWNSGSRAAPQKPSQEKEPH